jgi:uncharacterized protein (DUF2141 family)
MTNRLYPSGSRIRVLRSWWLAALVMGSALIFAVCPARAGGAVGTIHVHMKLRNDRGQVICTLFTPADKFPDQSHKGMTIAVPISNKHAVCRFKDVPYGNYAIVVFHDENRDGEFNQNWLGMPKEGFGFSNNPGTLKKPVFDDAKVNLDRPEVDIEVKLNYWL